jgi:hypothetical protein
MERILVQLPNGDTLETHISSGATVREVLLQLLERFAAILKAKSTLAFLHLAEWRLTLTPQLPANGRMTCLLMTTDTHT